MIFKSFVHLPGIGAETERRFWDEGVQCWDDLESRLDLLFGPKRALKVAAALAESRAAYEKRAFTHFRFKGTEMWRLVPDLLDAGLADEIAYLDIESTGLDFPPRGHSTTIAVLFRGQLRVEHERARKLEILAQLERDARLLVTFNGSTFDLPYLRREFGLKLQQPHLDLRYWFSRLDFRGGLKSVQTRFPEVHQRSSLDIDGFDAVRLWDLHKRGVARALETLMTYNAEDTIVLEQLLYCGLNLEAGARPKLGLRQYKIPRPPQLATQVCPDVYALL